MKVVASDDHVSTMAALTYSSLGYLALTAFVFDMSCPYRCPCVKLTEKVWIRLGLGVGRKTQLAQVASRIFCVGLLSSVPT